MLILFNICNGLDLLFPLEIVGLCVPTSNVGDFTFFIVGSKLWNYHARCTSSTNTFLRDIIAAAATAAAAAAAPAAPAAAAAAAAAAVYITDH